MTMTTTTNAHVLDRIERQLTAEGVPLGDLQARVAVELDVSPDDYFAYRLVSIAIEHYAAMVCDSHEAQALPDAAAGGSVRLAASLAEAIGWAASRIYRATAGGDQPELHAAAAEIIGAALQLRANLSAPPPREEHERDRPQSTPTANDEEASRNAR